MQRRRLHLELQQPPADPEPAPRAHRHAAGHPRRGQEGRTRRVSVHAATSAVIVTTRVHFQFMLKILCHTVTVQIKICNN